MRGGSRSQIQLCFPECPVFKEAVCSRTISLFESHFQRSARSRDFHKCRQDLHEKHVLQFKTNMHSNIHFIYPYLNYDYANSNMKKCLKKVVGS